MTNDNQIEMLEETIDKGIKAEQQKKADTAAAKAAEKLAKKEAAELKSRVDALLAFNERYSNGPELNNNGETLREWAERVC